MLTDVSFACRNTEDLHDGAHNREKVPGFMAQISHGLPGWGELVPGQLWVEARNLSCLLSWIGMGHKTQPMNANKITMFIRASW